MNGTKWYKLNKSNESLQVFLEERFADLEANISSKISSVIESVGEIVFSAGLSFTLEKKTDPLNFIWNKFTLFQEESLSFLRMSLSCAIIFLLSMAFCHLLVLGVDKIKKYITDDKETPQDAYRLEEYFYKQVLNDIVTGISLEKKACELSQNMNVKTTLKQDSDLHIIYLIESVFYFNEAIYNINEHNIFEINNPARENYTDFLKSINSDVICNIFQICIETLERIIVELQIEEKNYQMAEDAKKIFLEYVNSIRKQVQSK